VEVNQQWLRDICSREGYEIRDSEHPETFHAFHQTRLSLLITMSSNGPVVFVSSALMFRKPGWTEKRALRDAVDKFNSEAWLCKAEVAGPDSLIFSTFIYLTEQLSGKDVAIFLEMFGDDVTKRLNSSGLVQFS
jgi:hypothetical protein